MDTISLLLGPQWQPFLVSPKVAARMKDQDRIFELLLSQFPAVDTISSLPLKRLLFHTADEYVNPKYLELQPVAEMKSLYAKNRYKYSGKGR